MQQNDKRKNHEEEEEVARWRKAEISAAIVHLYYMTGQNFEPDALPRDTIAKMLGVTRFTVYRCINDAKSALDLAVEMKKRLVVYHNENKERIAIRDENRRRAKVRAKAKARERYRRQKEAKLKERRRQQQDIQGL